MLLTGKDIAACLGIGWECLSPQARPLYEELATKINECYFLPSQRENYALRALVQEYQTFISPLRVMVHYPQFSKTRELFERSSRLLGEEEQKVR